MDRDSFREALLVVMEQKVHWSAPRFADGTVPREKLHVHFEQEYATYVRDFPVMVGHAYVQCPIPAVRRELAENLYEEETGGLVAGRPHPELFLAYPRGLGMDLARFESVVLLPAAAAYRALLDETTQRNAHMAQNMARVAEALQDQAGQVMRVLSAFAVRATARHGSEVAAPPDHDAMVDAGPAGGTGLEARAA